jgi:hypothetical protein
MIARNRINTNVDNVMGISLDHLHWDVQYIELPDVLWMVGIHIDPVGVINGALCWWDPFIGVLGRARSKVKSRHRGG